MAPRGEPSASVGPQPGARGDDYSRCVVTALYRRYRPETFAELIGQAQVTDPLRTALRTDRVNHAYLFSGPRGCGKTTSARILARCLNCAEGPTDTPCGTCASCVELARDGGGSLDVVEIDAASHNGVDDARDLRERAAFAPARDRYKIFILDEAHMVTPQGFNALLKLVEEPPEHIKFIFATTEPEKVIGTIRSRTHHYPFRLVPPAQMLDYVQKMCADEGVEVEGGVLPLVVRAGGGSVRDTLSLLDQLIAGSDPATGSGTAVLGYERAVALLGYTHGALLDEVVDAIAARDAGAVFAAVDRVIQTGQDPRRFVEDLLERLRDLIVVAATRDGASAVLRGVPLEEIDRMSGQSAAFGAAELSRAADVVNTALTEMTGATSPRLHLELMVARLLVPAADETERGALARVERLERRMGIDEHPSMRIAPDRPAVEPVDIRTARKAKEEPAPGPQRSVEPPAPEEPPAAGEPPSGEPPAPVTLQQIRDAWPEILEIVKNSKRNAWMALAASTPRAYTGDVLTVAFATEADVASFKQPQGPGESVSEHLRGAIHEVLGVRVKFLARHEAAAEPHPDPQPAPPKEPPPAPSESVAENPLPPAPEWNVVSIPSSEPAAADTQPSAPEPEASAPQPEPAVPATPPTPAGERRAPQPHTADGKARYGEAVVREILGASFIEEQPLRPVDPPAPLDALDD
jgi:DNA polymerase-3 subunit gamma/tau